MEDQEKKTLFEMLLEVKGKAQEFTLVEDERRKLRTWALNSYRAILKIYGRNSKITQDFRVLIKLIRGRDKELPHEELKNSIDKIISLVDKLEDLSGDKKFIEVSETSKFPNNNNIFVIHGHDELNTHRLLNLLQNDFQLNPIAIFLKPGQSMSLLDKFENNASTCSFAFALLSKDDEIHKSDELYHQARPNVIFEAGWFTGRLGKKRLVLLLKNGVKIHSDYDGISRIQFNESVVEKYKDIKLELEAASLITTV